MQVILRTDVDKVGLRGEVVDVAPGFARNFLLPRKLAERATPGRVAELQKLEQRRARHEAQSFEQAQEIAKTLEQTELRFDVKAGPTGSLFGSVTPTDIADELWDKAKVRVDRRKIDLPEPLKRIGRYEVPIELFTDVTVAVRTLVVPEGGELPPEEELEAMRARGRGRSSGSCGRGWRAERRHRGCCRGGRSRGRGGRRGCRGGDRAAGRSGGRTDPRRRIRPVRGCGTGRRNRHKNALTRPQHPPQVCGGVHELPAPSEKSLLDNSPPPGDDVRFPVDHARTHVLSAANRALDEGS